MQPLTFARSDDEQRGQSCSISAGHKGSFITTTPWRELVDNYYLPGLHFLPRSRIMLSAHSYLMFTLTFFYSMEC